MLRKLLVYLGKMLKDPKVVSQIWSDYETVDNEVFSHLHIKFNMEDEKVMIQTAAKDVTGTPIKQAIAPLKPKGPTAPEPVNIQNYQIEGEYDIAMHVPKPAPQPAPQPVLAPQPQNSP